MIYLISLTSNPGGSDCLNFSALSLSFRTSVYKYFEQRTLNFALLLFFFILTDLASVLLDIIINSLISFTCFAILTYLASVERKRIRLVSLINRPFSSLIILIDLLFDNLICWLSQELIMISLSHDLIMSHSSHDFINDRNQQQMYQKRLNTLV